MDALPPFSSQAYIDSSSRLHPSISLSQHLRRLSISLPPEPKLARRYALSGPSRTVFHSGPLRLLLASVCEPIPIDLLSLTIYDADRAPLDLTFSSLVKRLNPLRFEIFADWSSSDRARGRFAATYQHLGVLKGWTRLKELHFERTFVRFKIGRTSYPFHVALP